MRTLLGFAVVTVGLFPWAALAQTDSNAPAASPLARFGSPPRSAVDVQKAAREVGAILANQCVSCHGPEKKKGGLDLTRRARALAGGKSGPVIVPGAPDESLLVDKVAEGEMPPKGALSGEQVARVRAWVASGAPYPSEPLAPTRAGSDWWSLRPVRRVSPPRGDLDGPKAAWIRTPVDAFVMAGLKSRGLTPSPPADRATLLRRATFDLTGLPPSPEAVDAFVADPDPLAYEALIDRLLASPQYGERWGRHWLDVVRFGESQGYETNLPRPTAWPYRDYVIRAFNRDVAFPRFVLEQLAGDTLLARAGSARPPMSELETGAHSDGNKDFAEGADWLCQAATGFLVGGTHDIVGNQTIEGMLQQRVDDLDDMITATATAFLGLTVHCARCHDHKFDPITQQDYYGLQAVLAGVEHAERELSAPNAEERRQKAAGIAALLARVEECLDAFEPLAQLGRDTPARPMVNSRRNVERFAPVPAQMVRLTILATSDRTEPCLDEVEVYPATAGRDSVPRNVALASARATASASSEYPNSARHKIAHLNDGRPGNSRSWISRAPGMGSVTIAWPEPATIDRVVWGRDREGIYRDRLATEYYLEAALGPGQWRAVASSLDRVPYRADPGASAGARASAGAAAQPAGLCPSRVRQRAELMARRAALQEQLSQLSATLKVYAGTFRQPGPTHLLIRGDPTRKGREVRPSGIAAVAPPLVVNSQGSEAARRRALAHWIADPANPLPARVMVNRLWQYHFGRGIVATPSDFGFNGAPPSNPELLDWLAGAYIAGGWRLKPVHRLIMTSATYCQSSRLDRAAQSIDRDNRLLWRMTPRRLEAESIRDAILATSGRLDLRMGGPGYNIWENNTNYVAVYKPRAELGPEAFRRMVYQFKPRSQPDPTFGAFDCPDAALVAPRRNVSTTALQSLNLLNSRFVVQQAGFFAQRLEAEAGPDRARQAERGFRLAFGRGPSPTERAAAIQLINSHGTAAFCRALYNANEFVYVP
jgi:mono/diheme cytochrome c family protein